MEEGRDLLDGVGPVTDVVAVRHPVEGAGRGAHALVDKDGPALQFGVVEDNGISVPLAAGIIVEMRQRFSHFHHQLLQYRIFLLMDVHAADAADAEYAAAQAAGSAAAAAAAAKYAKEPGGQGLPPAAAVTGRRARVGQLVPHVRYRRPAVPSSGTDAEAFGPVLPAAAAARRGGGRGADFMVLAVRLLRIAAAACRLQYGECVVVVIVRVCGCV